MTLSRGILLPKHLETGCVTLHGSVQNAEVRLSVSRLIPEVTKFLELDPPSEGLRLSEQAVGPRRPRTDGEKEIGLCEPREPLLVSEGEEGEGIDGEKEGKR